MEALQIKELTDQLLKVQAQHQKVIEENNQTCKSLGEAIKKERERSSELKIVIDNLQKDIDTKTDEIRTLQAREEARKTYDTDDGLTELFLKSDSKMNDESAIKLAKSIRKDPYAEKYRKNFLNLLRDPKTQGASSVTTKHNEYVDEIKKSSIHEDESYIKKSLNTMQEPGNFLVPPQIELKIHKQLRETSPIRMVADVKMIGSNEFKTYVENKIPIATFEGDPESDQFKDSDEMTYSEVKIPVRSLRAMPELSSNIIQDAFIDIESELINRLMFAYELAENKAFIDGKGDPASFYGIIGFYAPRGKEAPTYDEPQKIHVKSATKASLTGDNMVALIDTFSDMESDIISGWKRRGAYWLMHRKFKHLIRIIKDKNNQFLLSQLPGFGGVRGLQRIQDGVDGTIFGYPVLECDDMDRTIDAGNYPVAFGHWKNYCIVDRLGLNMLIDPFTSGKASVRYKTWKRVGAGFILGQGTTVLKVT